MKTMDLFAITAHIRRMGEGNSFSLLVCPQGGGGYLPWPGPRYLPPKARSGWGEGVPQGTFPPVGSGWGEGYSKVPTPQPRYLPPPPPHQGLAIRRAVCLLRSRRRTFLFIVMSGKHQGFSLEDGKNHLMKKNHLMMDLCSVLNFLET